jgi:uncharacterized protein YebE (UPF0316 family)
MELAILGYLAVFLARVTDVSLSTVRILMLMRGKKLVAAAVGFCEVSVYIIALKYVFSSLSDWTTLVFYALGYACGNIVGVWLEERLALGFLLMRVITQHDAASLAEILRGKGFGVTLFPCQGREGNRYYMLNIVCERRKLAILEPIVMGWDEKAFVTISDARAIRGGYM